MRILIIRLSAIGDVLRVLPALNCLRENFPHAEIHWLVEDKASGVLSGHPQIDKLLIWQRKKVKKEIRSASTFIPALSYVFSLFSEISKADYDIVFDFHGVLKSGIFSGSTFAPVRVGFGRKDSKEGNFLFNTHHCTLSDAGMNRVLRNLRLLDCYGVKNCRTEAVFPVSDKDRIFASDFFRDNGLEKEKTFSFYPGSSPVAKYKRWNPEKYIELCNRLNSEYGSRSLILWGPGEEDIADMINSAVKNSVPVPLTTLGELSALISNSALFIGGDTGPMHMAWLLGVPTVAVFCPTDPVTNCPPESPLSTHVHPDIDCAPCRKKDCTKGLCIEAVTTEIVFRKTVSLLSAKT